ncbi:MAG TPA: DUF305 domain-containing protein [Pilimelia sp.]|nr:DUF305 domain-containing protein [Pilimelia sp.]
MKRFLPTLLASLLGLATLAGLSACGTAGPGEGQYSAAPGASPSNTVPTTAFNDTDVMFLQMMVPHHQQGIEIVKLAASREAREEVKILAAAIATTQASEITTMQKWLKDWKQPPTARADAHAAHGGMPGTTKAEIDKVAKLDPSEFERQFLQMLLAHQDDAVQMARRELDAGLNPLAKEMAKRIELSRQAQIKQIQGFLGQG